MSWEIYKWEITKELVPLALGWLGTTGEDLSAVSPNRRLDWDEFRLGMGPKKKDPLMGMKGPVLGKA
ncbi:MAG TPA: hypothetical protein VK555_08700 [Terriglobales bacterium]|nr:hypothetical protein [Terriglobales bacterium]